MAAGITTEDKAEWIKQRPATTLVISSKLVIWSAPFHLLIIDKHGHIWPYFPLLAQTDNTALPVHLGPASPRCTQLNGSDRKHLEVEFEWKGGYVLSTHAQWKSHLPGISLISSCELNKEKWSSNHFRQTLYGIKCCICDEGSNYGIKGRAKSLNNAVLFELIEH